MRLPLQLWLPELTAVPTLEVRRDRERAFQAWRGEQAVWLVPGLDKPAQRWEEGGARLLAVRSDHWDQLTVFHVGRSGYVVGSAGVFPDNRIDNLLSAWLNMPKAEDQSFVMKPLGGAGLPLLVPTFLDAGVRYESYEVPLDLLGQYPTTLDDPPTPPRMDSVSDAVPAYVIQCMTPRATDPSQDTPPVPFVLTWPEPFKALMPALSGLGDILEQERMVDLAERSADELERTHLAAREAAVPYLFNGTTSVWEAEWHPILAEGGEEALLFEAEGKLRIEVNTLAKLFDHEGFLTIMSRPVSILRAWGPLGLFWALFLDYLETGRAFGTCHRCGRVIPGARKNQTYCRPKDSIDCYRARNAADQRRSRVRRG